MVNNQQAYVNTAKGIHTQGIEPSCFNAKIKIFKEVARAVFQLIAHF